MADWEQGDLFRRYNELKARTAPVSDRERIFAIIDAGLRGDIESSSTWHVRMVFTRGWASGAPRA
jgi:hypothetical protein